MILQKSLYDADLLLNKHFQYQHTNEENSAA